jgi:hypothetical protein
MADDNITYNLRTRGGRAAAGEIDKMAGSVKRLGASSRQTAKHTTLLGRATRGLGSPLRHLEKEALSAAKGMLAFGLAFGTLEGIKGAIDTTDKLVKTTVKLHHQFGLTTEAASGLAGVLQARDIDPAALNMGLTTLSKQLVAAEHGTKKAQGGLRILGIRARDVHQAVGSRDGLSNVFERVVDRMSKMPGSARKAALGQQLLGRASKGLAPLLQEGALGLRQQLKWAKEYGVTLDGHTVGSVEEMVAAQAQAQYAMLGLQIQLGRFAAPAITKANMTLAEIVKSFRDGRPEGNQFARTVYKLGVDLKPVGHDLAVVGGYLKDHPRLLRAAALGYVAYRLKLLKLISIAPKAYLEGLGAGRAFSRGYAMGSSTTLAGDFRARSGAISGAGRVLGGILGAGAVLGMEAVFTDWLLHKLGKSFDELTKGLHAADFDKTVQRGRALEHDPVTLRAIRRWQRAHPGIDPVHTSARRLASLGYPALIPGGPGVPRGYKPTTSAHQPARRRAVTHEHIHLDVNGKPLANAIRRVVRDEQARR